ncbi:MAG: hypothetical protein WCJ29_01315 [bacterium]
MAVVIRVYGLPSAGEQRALRHSLEDAMQQCLSTPEFKPEVCVHVLSEYSGATKLTVFIDLDLDARMPTDAPAAVREKVAKIVDEYTKKHMSWCTQVHVRMLLCVCRDGVVHHAIV